jgi:hypothetical protein
MTFLFSYIYISKLLTIIQCIISVAVAVSLGDFPVSVRDELINVSKPELCEYHFQVFVRVPSDLVWFDDLQLKF